MPGLIFVGEQDGFAKSELEERLWTELYRWGNVTAAYLSRARHDDSQDVSIYLALRVKNGTDKSLLEALRPLVAEGLPGSAEITIAFITAEEEVELARVCKPFYPKKRPRQEAYHSLRDQILQGTREKFNLPPTSSPTEPWGVLMDWSMSKAGLSVVASVVALSDGHASIYLSTGGGNIGGGQSDDSVRMAAQAAVTLADMVQPQTHITSTFPLPKPDEVTFYLLTDAGVFSSAAMSNEMGPGHLLSKLGGAMQQIISKYGRTKKAD